MEITWIGHSGFLIELPKYNLIFDYFTDKKNIVKPEIFKDKRTCVFVSHSHFDHYNKKIFEWNNLGDIEYIADCGCRVPDKYKSAKVTAVSENCEYNFFNGEIGVKTYGSTDEGVSFLVTACGFTLFHAGDLNDWYWEGESTEEELMQDEGRYLQIIKQIAGQKIDVAFIPKDPRLKHNANRGIEHFEKIVAPKKIIPMHFKN